MIPDTRKDPRAKVLSMTVRYKSATIDEFIEHHSFDVSRGGMFIKTPSPFPPGTLLKFEVRIADEQKVMQGVGRVVWKREASSAASDSPSGMGVKFIKLDDDSKGVIDQLVGKRGGAEGTYDTGERAAAVGGPAAAPAAAAKPAAPPADKPVPMRKGTMIGLGAVKLPDAPAKDAGGGFFPNSEPANLPNPEDRTVMRQAAELLRDALREAGGSMEEIGGAGAAPVAAVEPAKAAEPEKIPAPRAAEPRTPAEPAPRAAEKPAPRAVAKSSDRPAPRPLSDRPVESVPAPKPSGGSKSAIWMILGVLVVGGGIFVAMQRSKPEPSPEPTAATPPPAAVPTAAETASAAPEATAEPSAAPSASAAPEETPAQKAAREKAEAEATKKAETEAKKAEAEAKKAADAEAKKAAAEAKKAELDAKKAALEEARSTARAAAAARAATVMRAAPAPAPAPAAPAAPAEAPAEKPAAAAPAPTPAPAEKPAAAAPAEKPAAPAPKPAAAPKPAPAPKESDNPY